MPCKYNEKMQYPKIKGTDSFEPSTGRLFIVAPGKSNRRVFIPFLIQMKRTTRCCNGSTRSYDSSTRS